MRFEISEVMNKDQVMDLVYGNNSSPGEILGRHIVGDGQVISAYHPDAVTMELIDSHGKRYPMDPVERQPVFAVYLPGTKEFTYVIRMTFQDGNTYVSEDPYIFSSWITPEEEKAFTSGTWAEAYEKMGAHPLKKNGVYGTSFAIWAPEARRVSVVGDFNFWNGMIYPMHKISDSGIFTLFLPRISAGMFYKFEIKDYQGHIRQICDPFATSGENTEGGASCIYDMDYYRWKDYTWMFRRRRNRVPRIHSICRILSLSSDQETDHMKEILLKEEHSHVLIANGKDLQTGRHSAFALPYGTPDQMKSAIDRFHAAGTGVILEIPPEYLEEGVRTFSSSEQELSGFLYTLLMFWIKEYHVDGIAFLGYEDKKKETGRIDSHMFGRHAMDERVIRVLGQLRQAVQSKSPEIVFIWDNRNPNVLPEGKNDYYWNERIRFYFCRYADAPMEQKREYYYLLSLVLQRENLKDSVLMLNGDRIPEQETVSVDSFAFEDYDRVSERRLRYGFMLGVPGIKARVIRSDESPGFRVFVSRLLQMYRLYPALHEYDPKKAPMRFVNVSDAESLVMSFIRYSPSGRDHLLFVSNFDEEPKKDFRIGVPVKGTYSLVMSSDSVEYGGEDRMEIAQYQAEEISYDLMPYSITVSLPKETVYILRF